MEVSKITISNDTMNQYKNLSKAEIGRLRYKRLKELDESGELSLCKTRADLGKMLGISAKNSGAFISRAVENGHLTEILIAKHGRKGEYEYHYPNKAPKIEVPTTENRPQATDKKAVVRCGDIEVSLDGYSIEDIVKIVKGLKKGE